MGMFTSASMLRVNQRTVERGSLPLERVRGRHRRMQMEEGLRMKKSLLVTRRSKGQMQRVNQRTVRRS